VAPAAAAAAADDDADDDLVAVVQCTVKVASLVKVAVAFCMAVAVKQQALAC